MNVTCTHCVNEFEVRPDVDGSTPAEGPCPACGRTTAFRSDDEAAAGGMFARASAEAAREAAAAKPKDASLLITIGEVQRIGQGLRAASSSSLPQGGSMLADIRMIKSVIAQQEQDRKAAKQQQGAAALLGGKPGALPPVVPMVVAPIAVPRSGGRPTWILPVLIIVGLAVVASIVALVIVMGGSKKEKGKGEGTASAEMQPTEMAPPPAPDAGPAKAPDMAADAMKAPDMAADAMKAPEPMTPPRPAGPVAQLGPAEIDQGIATVKDRFAGCNKGQPGDYPFSLTVEGKTGKVTIAYLPRNKRGSATGKCLQDLMGKAQFPTFTKKKQVVPYTATVK